MAMADLQMLEESIVGCRFWRLRSGEEAGRAAWRLGGSSGPVMMAGGGGAAAAAPGEEKTEFTVRC